MLGCSSVKKQNTLIKDLKHVVIYKTKKDYNSNVPITYSKKINAITSYPAPSDVKPLINQRIISLKLGYKLDVIGVNTNTVYTNYTLKEYSELDRAPNLETLTKSIIDYEPYTELYDLGQLDDSNNTIGKINKLIKSGEIKPYKKK